MRLEDTVFPGVCDAVVVSWDDGVMLGDVHRDRVPEGVGELDAVCNGVGVTEGAENLVVSWVARVCTSPLDRARLYTNSAPTSTSEQSTLD